MSNTLARVAIITEELRRVNAKLELELSLSSSGQTTSHSSALLRELAVQCNRTARIAKSAHSAGLELSHLPSEVLLAIMASLPPHAVGLLDSTSRRFHGCPAPASLVAIACRTRLRALQSNGYLASPHNESWATALAVAEGQQCNAQSTVAAGVDHTLLVVHGKVAACGSNGQGRCGLEQDKPSFKMQWIAALCHIKVASVAAGGSHSLAVSVDGKLFSWGYGAGGKLGHGDELDRATPTEVTQARTEIRRRFHSDIVTKNADEDCPLPKVHSIAAASHHSLISTKEGEVFTFGHPGHDRLGIRHPVTVEEEGQILMPQIQPPANVLRPTNIRLEQYAMRRGEGRVMQVSAHSFHSLALTAEGKVYAWGRNDKGQLGIRSEGTPSMLPALVPNISDRRLVCIAAGLEHSAAVTAKGVLFTFGSVGPWLGTGPAHPAEVHNNGKQPPTVVDALWGIPVASVSAGDSYTAIVLRDGRVMTCGLGEKGVLGHGNEADIDTPQPVPIPPSPPGMLPVVAAGTIHCGVLTHGGLWAFGAGEHGKLGAGNDEDQWAPVECPPPVQPG